MERVPLHPGCSVELHRRHATLQILLFQAKAIGRKQGDAVGKVPAKLRLMRKYI